MQKGPWNHEEGTVIDNDANVVNINENAELIAHAPDMNHYIGEVLDIVNNPYTNDKERVNKLTNLAQVLSELYISEVDYE